MKQKLLFLTVSFSTGILFKAQTDVGIGIPNSQTTLDVNGNVNSCTKLKRSFV